MVTLDVVLASGKIPHEVAPVHPSHLVTVEEGHILRKGGFPAHRRLACPILVVGGMLASLVGAVHSGEEARVRLVIGVFLGIGADLVVVTSQIVRRADIFGIVVLRRNRVAGRVVRTCQERRFAVLLTSQIGAHGHSVFRRILIERRIGVGTYHQNEERGIADHQQCEAQQCGVDHLTVLALDDVVRGHTQQAQHKEEAHAGVLGADLGHNQQQEHHRQHNDIDRLAGTLQVRIVPKAPQHKHGHQQEEHHRTGIEAHVQLVDKEHVEIARKVHYAGNDAPQDDSKDKQRNDTAENEAFSRLLEFLEIDHIHYGRYGQQVEQVHSDGNTHQETHQHQPAQRMRVVGLLLPFQDGPEHHRRKERRHGVNLALNCREPIGVAEGVGQCTYYARCKNRPHFTVVQCQLLRLQQLLAQ